jgi:hypothetical protein
MAKNEEAVKANGIGMEVSELDGLDSDFAGAAKNSYYEDLEEEDVEVLENNVVLNYVSRESFILGKKRFYKYFIVDKVHGRDVHIDLYPKNGKDDKQGYLILGMLFDDLKAANFRVVKTRMERNGKKVWLYSFEIFGDSVDRETGEVDFFKVSVVPSTQSNRELLAVLLQRRGINIDGLKK